MQSRLEDPDEVGLVAAHTFERHRRAGAARRLGNAVGGVLEGDSLDMGAPVGSGPYLILMIAVVVVVDWRFLRRDAVRRLVVNVAIVLAFLAFYLTFMYQC